MTSIIASRKINKISTLLVDAFSGFPQADTSNQKSDSNISVGMKFKKFKRVVRRSSYLPFIIVGALVIIVVIVGWNNYNSRSGGSTVASLTTKSDGRFDVKKPTAEQELNKQFLFPLNDDKGKEVSKLKFIIENAQLRNEIIVGGERATSVVGRTFLVVNVKIINDFEQSIQINVRDYLRLTINGSSEKLAPEIHNDPVEVQAISTKYTRVAFPVDDDAKNLELLVGEITKDKQKIQLNFN